MVGVLLLFSLYLLGLTNGQETFKLINLHDSHHLVLQSLNHKNVPIAVSVSDEDLPRVSSSVLMAETWLRTHVLTHYPSTKITTIVVGNTVLCNPNHENKWSLVLPSVRNLYHSLVRWGLEKEIKVSPSFSIDCIRDNLAENLLKPILDFLHSSNSTYSINPPPHFSPYETINLISTTHKAFIKNLGFLHQNEINVLLIVSKSHQREKPMIRKLSFVSLEKNPTLPSSQNAPPPAEDFSFAPDGPPVIVPANPPDSFMNPPCVVAPAVPPVAGRGGKKGLWCVAKPSVPSETLQEAMDYACGEGGADCVEIKPYGSCYSPNTIVAHASYAFNSYWQKNKNKGGSCSFGGTAIIINSDPSFLHCHFILA
ncbi:O-Glycosyl hydrolases family 17 protein [Tasmannia lanceolata]|uniref:O-Glycosyl hydrolases family 17 protein n=1 Tax=Tasmannia lanceolata TaxID=3420 RepID=UPI004063492F